MGGLPARRVLRRAGGAAEQALIFGFRDAVGAVGLLDEALAVEHYDQAAGRSYQALSLEIMQPDGDARSAHPQHHGEEFVGDPQLAARETIVGHQNPAGEALLELGSSVGERGLAGL